MELGKVAQARDALEEAIITAEYTGERTVLWQVLALLGDLETMSGNEPEAARLRVPSDISSTL